jgi:hypothetical protein
MFPDSQSSLNVISYISTKKKIKSEVVMGMRFKAMHKQPVQGVLKPPGSISTPIVELFWDI